MESMYTEKWQYGILPERAALQHSLHIQVIYTIPDQFQLVLISLPPLQDLGSETHSHTLFLYVERGLGVALLGNQRTNLTPGSRITILPDVVHNIQNLSSDTPMRLYLTYRPPRYMIDTFYHPEQEQESYKGENRNREMRQMDDDNDDHQYNIALTLIQNHGGETLLTPRSRLEWILVMNDVFRTHSIHLSLPTLLKYVEHGVRCGALPHSSPRHERVDYTNSEDVYVKMHTIDDFSPEQLFGELPTEEEDAISKDVIFKKMSALSKTM